MTAVLDVPGARPAVPSSSPTAGVARPWVRVLVVVLLATWAELLSPRGWGWPALAAAFVLAAASMPGWGAALLDRVVPAIWLWVAAMVLLGWLSPFLPWLARPGIVVLLAAVPWLAPGGSWPQRRLRPSAAAVREWTAGLVPAAVLSVPALVHRDLAGLVTTLSLGWDTPNHLLLLRGALLSPGVTLYGPRPDLLLPGELLDYPSGAHQVWAAGGRLLGLPGAAATDVVAAYPWLVAATWALLGLTAVWAYRRLVPWGRRRPGLDLIGLGVLVVAVAVSPLPGLWWSGFHNFVLAAAALLLLLGLGVRPGRRGAWPLLLACAALVTVTATYPLLAPVAGLGWLVVVLRTARDGTDGARRAVALAVVGTAVALFPSLVPYLAGRGAGQLLVAGGMVQPPLAALVVMLGLVAIGSWAWPPLGRRLRRGAVVPVASLLLVVGVSAATLRATGLVGYYADKAAYALLVVLVPCAAAGAASLALAWSRSPSTSRMRWAGALVATTALAAAAVPASSLVPHDPLGLPSLLAGPEYLARALSSPQRGSTSGARVLAVAAWSTSTGSAPAWVVPVSSVEGPAALSAPALVAEGHWLDVLVPVNVSSSRLFVSLAGSGAGTAEITCAAAVFARHHPDVPVLVLADDSAQAAAVRAAARTCQEPTARSIGVGIGSLPAPLPEQLARAVPASA